MTPALAVCLLVAVGAGPPYHERPVDPQTDLAQLRAEVHDGRARQDVWQEKLQLYLALGELQTIPELVALLGETFPEHPVFQEARMMFLSLDGQHAAATALGEHLLRRHPEHPTILTNLGRVYIAAGQRPRGVNLLLAAVERGPIRSEDWSLLLAGLGLGAADPDQVVATLRQKVTEHPERSGLRYVLMVALTRLGRYAEARQILIDTPALAAHPDLQGFLDDTQSTR